MMNRIWERTACLVLWIGGTLVFTTGLLHLWATSYVMQLFESGEAGSQSDVALAAAFINHVVVGVLLLPLGVSLACTAWPLARKEPWSVAVGVGNCLALLALPAILVIAVRPAMLDAPAFVAAVAMLTGAAFLVTGAVLILALRPSAAVSPFR